MSEHLRRPAADVIATMAGMRCVREVATMLALSRTGTEFDAERVEEAWGLIAAAADEHHASPDIVQAALEFHEPVLKPEQGVEDYL